MPRPERRIRPGARTAGSGHKTETTGADVGATSSAVAELLPASPAATSHLAENGRRGRRLSNQHGAGDVVVVEGFPGDQGGSPSRSCSVSITRRARRRIAGSASRPDPAA